MTISPNERLVTIRKVSTQLDAEVLQIELKNAGIACALGGMDQAGLAGILPIEVIVREHDLDAAEEILSAHENSKQS